MRKFLRDGVQYFFCGSLLLAACQSKPETLFERASSSSGIDFKNIIEESAAINILSYEYTYNGGGVAAADFNNDGRCDLYFTGNVVSNRLFINQGDLRFKDETEHAGVSGRRLWKTGVTAADVNGDGWMDLYVCYSGPDEGQSFSNELYINNGINDEGKLTFTERAKESGVDAEGTLSTQAAFFDYDRDGDLDMFLINHGNHFYSPFTNTNQLRNTRHPNFGNRLYKNNLVESGKATFSEVSQQAGIHGGGINFGLGVSISDLNKDGWPDIYVTNDYEEQDFLYLNNGDGTFTDATKRSLGHFSRNGMGTDIADFNNDGRTDIIEVDMWPEDNYRQKLLKGPDDHARYTLMVDSGFHFQQMRNTLQMNAGVDANGFPLFCEIGQLAGVSATDWSWSPLFADFDNDGFKDLFVTNGYLRDFTSMDFLKYTVEEARRKASAEKRELSLYELVSKMPSTKTQDYLYRNNGDLTFSNVTNAWGMDEPNLSFGSAYADLDNDGDLDLITNNTNEPAAIWVNKSERNKENNFLKIQLRGPRGNQHGVGATVIIEDNGMLQVQEQFQTRGYQSSVEPTVHFGLGKKSTIKKLTVIWPDQKVSLLSDVKSNQTITMDYNQASVTRVQSPVMSTPMFKDVTAPSAIDFVHHENNFNDFDREPLLPQQFSRLGPAVAGGDVNGDGLDDFFAGGAFGQSGALYIASASGKFTLRRNQPWEKDTDKENVGAIFFDADNDGDVDLFVVNGGNEFPTGSAQYDDRLYINDGNGNFTMGSTIEDHASGSCVVAADYDKDGDLDLFVGGRLNPGRFPETGPGALLRNDTDVNSQAIKFTVVTNELAPALREPGRVTDASWTDFNNDGWPDLVVVGEWMPIKFFENKKGKFELVNNSGLEASSGFWNRVVPFDFDGDGDTDYVAGNCGTNIPWKVSSSRPLALYSADFNNDQRIDPIMCFSVDGKEYPMASRDEMLFQVSALRKTYTTYSSYAAATAADMFEPTALQKATRLHVENVQSVLIENLGNSKFRLKALPTAAQLSSVNGILTGDFNNDSFPDILLSGNFYPYRTQYGRSDASVGLLLTGDGKGSFVPVQRDQSGFFTPGDVRNLILLNEYGKRKFVLVARNNDAMSLIGFTE